MRLLLIRHAQSMNNAHEDDPNYQHIEDAPLTPTGHMQASHLATFFRNEMESEERQQQLRENPTLPIYRIDRLLISPMQRTLQTSKALADVVESPPTLFMDGYERGGVFRRLGERGKERFMGLPGLNHQQMHDIVPSVQMPDAVTDSGWWTGGDGEELDDYIARGRRVARYFREQAQGAWADQWVALVTHADFTNMLSKMLVFGEDNITNPYDDGRMASYNTGITRFYIHPDTGTAYLLAFSQVNHLPYHLVTR